MVAVAVQAMGAGLVTVRVAAVLVVVSAGFVLAGWAVARGAWSE